MVGGAAPGCRTHPGNLSCAIGITSPSFCTSFESCLAILVIRSDGTDEYFSFPCKACQVGLVNPCELDSWLDAVRIQLAKLFGKGLELALRATSDCPFQVSWEMSCHMFCRVLPRVSSVATQRVSMQVLLQNDDGRSAHPVAPKTTISYWRWPCDMIADGEDVIWEKEGRMVMVNVLFTRMSEQVLRRGNRPGSHDGMVPFRTRCFSYRDASITCQANNSRGGAGKEMVRCSINSSCPNRPLASAFELLFLAEALAGLI